MLSRFIYLFIYFSYLACPPGATIVTDGLRGLGIDGRGILSLFPDIFPIATLLRLRLLTVHTNGERRQKQGRREKSDTLLYRF